MRTSFWNWGSCPFSFGTCLILLFLWSIDISVCYALDPCLFLSCHFLRLSLVSLDSFGFKNEVHPDCGASWLAAQEPASNNDSILWPYIPELLSIQGLFMFCMSESLFLGRSDLHPSLLRCLSWRTDSLISRIQVLYPFPVTWSLILLAKFLVLLLLPQATMSYGKNT